MCRKVSRLFVLMLAAAGYLSAPAASASPLQQVTVFQQGEGGYNTFRIPAIVQAPNGALLAFAEGRVNSASDFGNIDVVMKRSFDGGLTWSSLQVIDSNGSKEAGSATPVVDWNTGNIVLTYVIDRYTTDNPTVIPYPVCKISTDNGATWSARTDISATAKSPNWNHYALGTVHGIQLQRGPHAGRLVVAGNHTLADQPLNPAGREAHIIYSDDGGVTWQIGGLLVYPTSTRNPNESTVVELTDGRVYINSRNQNGADKRRLFGYSSDGGETFPDLAQVEYQLIDPVVQASLLRYAATDQGDAVNRILFANPASETARVRMTIKSSFDETVTWNGGKLVWRGPAGYSDMVRTTTGGGLLYENGTSAYYNRISFARFDTAWLDNPAVMQIDFRDYTANDQEGNGINGAFQGGLTFVTGDPRFGSGHAVHFDGDNDMVRIADTSNHILDFDATDSFTLEAVFRTTSHTSGGAGGSGPLIAKDVNSVGTPEYWLRVIDGNLQFTAYDGATLDRITGTTHVSDGKWHHVAAVFDRQSGLMSMYIDYQLEDTEIIDLTGGFANSNDLLLGAFNVSSSGYKRFLGDMDMARISMGALGMGDFVQPTFPPGDANGDGMVNLADLQILGDHWQSGDAYWLIGDFTGDGVVNLADLQVLGDHWGYGVSPDMTFDQALRQLGLSIPEPAVGFYLVIGVILLGCRTTTVLRARLSCPVD